MTCSKCNTENSSSAKFCIKCGYSLSEMKAEKIKANKFSAPFLKNRKLLNGVLVLIVLAGAGYFVKERFNFGGDSLSTSSLDELVKLNKEEGDQMAIAFVGGSLTKDKASEIYSGQKKINKLLRREVEGFLSTAKKIDIANQEKMKNFLDREEKIKELTGSESSCSMGKALVAGNLEKSDVDDSLKNKIMEEVNERCKISRLLDVCKIDRKTEFIEGSFDEEENLSIPIGYSIITKQPEKGEKAKITLAYDGQERGTSEVVTKEPVKGKKMKGTGQSIDVAKQTETILNQIFDLWQEQKMTASNILPFLDEQNQNKATDWESNYKKIVFNWLRFKDAKAQVDQVIFKENSYNQELPIITYLPMSVKNSNTNSSALIPFYYSATKNKWVTSNDTIAAIFKAVENQSIKAVKISPNKVLYTLNNNCKDGWFMNVSNGVTINSFGISGYNAINFNYTGNLNNYILTYKGSEMEVNVATSYYSSGLPVDFVSLINNGKINQLIGKSFEYTSYSCKSATNVEFIFFTEAEI